MRCSGAFGRSREQLATRVTWKRYCNRDRYVKKGESDRLHRLHLYKECKGA
jgi:hypothetical protein